MTTNGNSRLLWTDDDAPGRFSFEEIMLERAGWKIEWATSLDEALTKLSRDVFDAILLDQLLPARRPEPPKRATPNVWHGCRLLYWLRGSEWPATAPDLDEWDTLSERDLAPRSNSVPVVLVSNVFDEDVDAALHKIEPQLRQVVKPPRVDLLLTLLDETVRRAQGG